MDDGCGTGCDALGGERRQEVNRRQFLADGTLSVALLALAACGLDTTAPDAGTALTNPIVIADYAELATTGGRLLGRLANTPVVIVRTSDTTFVALSRVCPHQGSTIGTSGNGFRCPAHGATFDAGGNWIGGQPTTRMRAYSVSYDATAGTLTIG